jgi:CHAT domain-containing protein
MSEVVSTSTGMQRLMTFFPAALTCLLGLMCLLPVPGEARGPGPGPLMQQGITERGRGQITESIDDLEGVLPPPGTRISASQAKVLTQLAVSYLQADRLAEADKALTLALAASAGADQIPILLAQGNLALRRHQLDRAGELYQTVVRKGQGVPGAQGPVMAARLNLLRLQQTSPGAASSRSTRLDALEPLYTEVSELGDLALRGRAYLTLADLAYGDLTDDLAIARMGAGGHTTATSHVVDFVLRAQQAALSVAHGTHDERLEMQVLDAQAQLYEADGRNEDALRLDLGALRQLKEGPPGHLQDVALRLEWRAGRLERALGRPAAAGGSYLRAAIDFGEIRDDLPLEDSTGTSEYRSLVQPLVRDLLEQILGDVDERPREERERRLRVVTDVIETARQAELQDFLGERCAVESSREETGGGLKADDAVLYLTVVRKSVEMILLTRGHIEHRTARFQDLEAEVSTFKHDLQEAGSIAYEPEAQRLYTAFIVPFRDALVPIHHLVIVPDGPLRLIPFGALHDGAEFLAERYAISTAVGLTLASGAPLPGNPRSLLAGLSQPGPAVLQKLAAMGIVPNTGSASPILAANTRAVRGSGGSLTLVNVPKEIHDIEKYSAHVTILDGEFTVARLRGELQSGRYQRVHLASHAFFGDTARDSFLLAYDDVIRIDELQRLLTGGKGQTGIDLLTLSACETAEGDERAPLGLTGAAIKAQAHSVVGSLWAVDDEASRQFMAAFYEHLGHEGKADALRAAEKALLGSPKLSHPRFWAPFILIGDWR